MIHDSPARPWIFPRAGGVEGIQIRSTKSKILNEEEERDRNAEGPAARGAVTGMAGGNIPTPSHE
ncbi:hypothetical protein llg_26740 [Luteolibacter sp. LG18]|nr:hypothetical protein llg_26740 [Luteolibacter sp. LG18]